MRAAISLGKPPGRPVRPRSCRRWRVRPQRKPAPPSSTCWTATASACSAGPLAGGCLGSLPQRRRPAAVLAQPRASTRLACLPSWPLSSPFWLSRPAIGTSTASATTAAAASAQPAAAALLAAAQPTTDRLRPPATLSGHAAGRAHHPRSNSCRSAAGASAALQLLPDRCRIRLRRRPTSRRSFRRLAATPPPHSGVGPAQYLHRAQLLARLPVVVAVPALQAGHRHQHRHHHHLKAPQNRTRAHQCSGRCEQATEAQTHPPWST